MKWVLTLVAAVVLAGCASTGGAEPLKVRTLAKGGFSGIQQAKQIVARTQQEWDKLWASHAVQTSELKQPAVDFSKEMVLAVTMGRRSTGGYSIEIVSVASKAEKLVAVYEEKTPTGGGLSLQAITAPFHFVAVPKSKQDVSFLKASK